ncbi:MULTISPECIES: hypothetical protein [Blautia]|uniref:hypothetical protein n=1 Tax=Blautia TaxID=572511 RepID=UPI000BA3962E|nr:MULTISPECIES: hypothetical protein [Blautia]
MGEIAYQNKDIVSKILGDGMKEKSFSVYGIPMSKVKEVLPVNLPAIEANEMATDNLFKLEDSSYAVIDYESTFSEKSKIKYVNHIARILKKYGSNIRLRMIVLCTSGIRHINAVLDVGCLRLTVEPGYLSSINAEIILKTVRERIENREKLSDTEVMQLIILPLTEEKKEKQKVVLEEAVNLAKNIQDEEQQLFVLSGIITFSDKIIEPEFARQVEEWIRMTKVGRLFEEEKQQAVAAVMDLLEQERAITEQERAKKNQESLKVVSLKLLLKGSSPQEVSKATGLSLEEVKELLS